MAVANTYSFIFCNIAFTVFPLPHYSHIREIPQLDNEGKS